MVTGIKTKENGSDSRNTLLKVALELFTRHGYDGTSIDDIREAAGFKSKASLYTHFKSKEEIANALLTKWQGEQGDFVMQAYRAASPDPYSRFLAAGRAFAEWGLLHPEEYAYCFLRVQQERLMEGEYNYLTDQFYITMFVLVDQLREKYPVRAIANAALLSMMVGLIGKAVIDQGAFGHISLEEKLNQVMEMCQGVFFSEPISNQ